jgi:hypothetical protein
LILKLIDSTTLLCFVVWINLTQIKRLLFSDVTGPILMMGFSKAFKMGVYVQHAICGVTTLALGS